MSAGCSEHWAAKRGNCSHEYEYDFSTGKLDARLLASLLSRLPSDDERLIVPPRIGEDAAVIEFGDRYLIAKTDPITFATDEIGWYAVNVNANDIATMGAKPRWFMVSVLLPEGSTDERLAISIFDQVAAACRELDVFAVGGHTEVTYGLDRPIVVGCMLGEIEKDKLVTSSGAQVGDVVILTKGVPIEGTSLIAREKAEELLARGYDERFIERARNLLHNPGISVVREALLATDVARVHAMHDPTEGGLATGLHELALASGVGIEVDAQKIMVIEEGRKLCAEFGLDPLGTIASGALLIVTSPKDSIHVMEALDQNGIPSALIGKVIEPERGIVMRKDETTLLVPFYTKDEVAKLF